MRPIVTPLIIIPIAALLLAGGCDQAEPPAHATATATTTAAVDGPLPDRDLALAKRLLKQEQGVLVDVRTPGEFAAAHIEGAVNIPLRRIQRSTADIGELVGGDTKRPIVVYCRSGRRSGVAKQILMRGGHTRVTNFGGMTDWR